MQKIVYMSLVILCAIYTGSSEAYEIKKNLVVGVDISDDSAIFTNPQFIQKASKYIRSKVEKLPTISKVHAVTFGACAGYLESRGYDVKRVAPLDPQSPYRFNPLHRARTYEELMSLGQTLIKVPDGNNRVFSLAAINTLACFSRALHSFSPEHAGLDEILHLARRAQFSEKEVTDLILQVDDQAVQDSWLSIVKDASKGGVLNGSMSELQLALTLFNDPVICQNTTNDNLGEFPTLRKKKTAIFLELNEKSAETHGMTYLAPFFSQVFDSLLSDKNSELGLNVKLYLDEAAHFLPHISSAAMAYATLRRRNVSIMTCLQSLAQAEDIPKYQTILDNCWVKNFLNINNPKSLSQISQLMGLTEKEEGGRIIQRELMSAAEIAKMKNGSAICLINGLNPIFIDGLNGFFDDETLSKRAHLPVYSNNSSQIVTMSPRLLSPKMET
ncbi:type IV secretory system conjugative DNA transfer family protein [Terasakiella sp. SH-1]|uniref:type IV secretory system conjugative DNA transfer family protein n=1 Tax=Terasakiella sp. SH-1 TaxID=2560057 RepID=UPI001074793C|nr:type IV secretory system conjugative DNA transfer family protein [Terasakiella sp. SH-1]